MPFKIVTGLTYQLDHSGLVDWDRFRADNAHDDVVACSRECWSQIQNMPLSEVFVRAA
jgi:hypothetical protein